MKIIKSLIGMLQKADAFFNKVNNVVNDQLEITSSKFFNTKEEFLSEKTNLKQKFKNLISEFEGHDKDLAARLSKYRFETIFIKPEYTGIFGGFVDKKIQSLEEAAAYFGHGAKAEDVELTCIEFTETVNEIIFTFGGYRHIIYHNHFVFELYTTGFMMKDCYYANVYEALKDYEVKLYVELGKFTLRYDNVNLKYSELAWKYKEDFITIPWESCFTGKLKKTVKFKSEGNMYSPFEKIKPEFYNRQAATDFFSKKLGINIDEKELHLIYDDESYRWYYQYYFLSPTRFIWGVYNSRLVRETMAKKPENNFAASNHLKEGKPEKQLKIYYEAEEQDRYLIVLIKDGDIYPKYLMGKYAKHYNKTVSEYEYHNTSLYEVYDGNVSFEKVSKDMYDPAIWRQCLISFTSMEEALTELK